MAISTQQAQGLLITGAIQKYVETHVPTTHLQGFFTEKQYGVTSIPLSIIRNRKKIAVDVMRGTGGNVNGAAIESMKEIIPPMYHETFIVNSLRAYERAFGLPTSAPAPAHAAMLAEEVAEKLVELKGKIVRAKELQAGQALELGVITLGDGSVIDYKRQATSLVDGATVGGYWTSASTPVEKQLADGCKFIRLNTGNSTGLYDLTISGDAWITLQATDYFKTKANYQQVSLLSINTPTDRNGATYNGRITAGAFVLNVWTYDEVYDDANNASQRYINEFKAIITPSTGAAFEMAYGAVDQRYGNNGEVIRAAADYYVWDSLDSNSLNRTMHMTSAPVARLISVDAVYTLTIATAWNGGVE